MTLLIKDSLKNAFGLTEDEAVIASSYFQIRKLVKGNLLLTENSLASELAFISEGMARISAFTNDKEITQWIATNGCFMTDLNSFVFGSSSRFRIEALNNCTLFIISKHDYEQLHLYIENWSSIEKYFLVHCFTTLENRITQFLSMTAEERYNCFFDANKEIFNQIPLHYIASMLGMTPETFSRIRKKVIS